MNPLNYVLNQPIPPNKNPNPRLRRDNPFASLAASPTEYRAETHIPRANQYTEDELERFLDSARRRLAKDIAVEVLLSGGFDMELTPDPDNQTLRLRMALRVVKPPPNPRGLTATQSRVLQGEGRGDGYSSRKWLLDDGDVKVLHDGLHPGFQEGRAPAPAPTPTPEPTAAKVLSLLDEVEKDLLPGTDAGFVVALLRDRIADLRTGTPS